MPLFLAMFHIKSYSFDNNLIILFVFIIIYYCPKTETFLIRCGRQMIKDNRKAKVVGGHDTYEGEFPWIVSIRKNGQHHCGGIIVGQRWILTAAHCLQNELNNDLMIRVGEYDLYKYEQNTKDYSVAEKYIHNNYKRIYSFNRMHFINNADIALIRTENDIHLNEYVWPICFPPAIGLQDGRINSNWTNRIKNKSLFNGQTGIVVGWGKLNEKSEKHSEILQKAQIEIIDQHNCSQWFKLAGRNFNINDNILCAGYKNGGIDACHGDSGGPLLIKQIIQQNNDIITEYYYVAGIVSTGIGCARPLLPGIYTNVSVYLDWIQK